MRPRAGRRMPEKYSKKADENDDAAANPEFPTTAKPLKGEGSRNPSKQLQLEVDEADEELAPCTSRNSKTSKQLQLEEDEEDEELAPRTSQLISDPSKQLQLEVDEEDEELAPRSSRQQIDPSKQMQLEVDEEDEELAPRSSKQIGPSKQRQLEVDREDEDLAPRFSIQIITSKHVQLMDGEEDEVATHSSKKSNSSKQMQLGADREGEGLAPPTSKEDYTSKHVQLDVEPPLKKYRVSRLAGDREEGDRAVEMTEDQADLLNRELTRIQSYWQMRMDELKDSAVSEISRLEDKVKQNRDEKWLRLRKEEAHRQYCERHTNYMLAVRQEEDRRKAKGEAPLSGIAGKPDTEVRAPMYALHGSAEQFTQVEHETLQREGITMCKDMERVDEWIHKLQTFRHRYKGIVETTPRVMFWFSREMAWVIDGKMDRELEGWRRLDTEDLLELMLKVLGRDGVKGKNETLAGKVRNITQETLKKYDGRQDQRMRNWAVKVQDVYFKNSGQMGKFDQSRELVKLLVKELDKNVLLKTAQEELRSDMTGSGGLQDLLWKEYWPLIDKKVSEIKDVMDKSDRMRGLLDQRQDRVGEKRKFLGRPEEGGETPRHEKKGKGDKKSHIHERFNRPNETGKGKKSLERASCNTCGRRHEGQCKLTSHPNANRTAATWTESAAGKQWREFNHHTLPFHRQIQHGTLVDWGERPTPYTREKGDKKGYNENKSFTKRAGKCKEEPEVVPQLHHTVSEGDTTAANSELTLISFDEATIQAEISLTRETDQTAVFTPVNILIDTGSNLLNFVSQKTRNKLEQHGQVEVRSCDRRVKVGNSTVHTKECVVMRVRIRNKDFREEETLEVLAYVLDINHDVILGLQALKHHAALKKILFSNLINVNDLEWIQTLIANRSSKGARLNSEAEVTTNATEGGEATAKSSRRGNEKPEAESQENATGSSLPHSKEAEPTGNATRRDHEIREAITERLRHLERKREEQQRTEEKISQEKKDLQALLDQHYPEATETESKKKRKFQSNRRESAVVRRRVAELYAIRKTGETPQGQKSNTPERDGETAEIPTNIEGTEAQRKQLEAICKEYSDCFSSKLRMEAARIPPMHLEVADDWDTKENRRSPRPQGPKKEKEVDEQTEKMHQADVIRLSTASAHSQVLLTPKPDGSWRFCVDYRRLNASTRAERWPIPNIPKMLREIGDRKPMYFGVLDLTKGYYQAPLSESDKHYTAFITAKALYEWNRVPMGLMGAPAYFQRVMTTVVLAGLMFNSCQVYMDDIIVFGKSWEEYIENLRKVLERLRKYKLTANPKKTKLGLSQVEYVGHTIDSTGMSFEPKRIQEVVDFPKPTTLGELKSFLGLANYVRDNVEHASEYAVQLNGVLGGYTKKHKKKLVPWTTDLTRAFDDMKQAITKCQKLFWIDEKSPIHLYTDASEFGIGAYLCQVINGEERTIALLSRTLTPTQRRWSVPEKEAFAIYEAFRKFEYLIRDTHFTLHTDHKNLIFIRDTGSPKVVNWKVRMQEFDFEAVYIEGEKNDIADQLSRNLAAGQMEEEPDEYKVTDLNRMNLKSNEYVARKVAQFEAEEQGEDTEAALYAFDGTMSNQQNTILASVHNSSVGHNGVEATLGKLRKAGHQWQYMRQMMAQYIKQCDTCQKRDVRRIPHEVELFTTAGTSLMTERSIDFVGPLAKDAEGNEYLCTIIDTFSRWLEIYPCKNDSAECAAQALLQHYGRFGCPKKLRSDRGSEFVNSLIKEFNDKVGVEHVLSIGHSHEENGLIEGANKEVRRYMNDICYDKRLTKGEWSKNLPLIARIQNTMVKDMTGVSPAYMLYAGAIDLDTNMFLEADRTECKQKVEALANEHSNPKWKIWMKERQEAQRIAIELAQRNTAISTSEHMQKDKGLRTEFPVGSMVLKTVGNSQGEKPNKQQLMWKGPYKVQEIKGSTYTLIDIGNGKQLEPCNIHLLKDYHHDDIRTNPLEVRTKDSADQYIVEEVRGHEGRWSRRGSITFRVKWEGFPQETIEPWKNMRDNEKTHEYMTQIGMGKYIPNKFMV